MTHRIETNRRPRVRGSALVLLALALGTMPASLLAVPANPIPRQEITMQHAKGDFDVKINPLPLAGPAEDATLGRMSIEKEFHGDLVGTGKGQMLTAGAAEGSGAYVAIERVSATLAGRKGTFALYHKGIMTRGTPDLAVIVVPDSGTEELAGISGILHIIIEGGKHGYDFEYSLPAQP
ncbi:MAG TPA: DUF3224 domain-containing protein [Thermoanaerobaculia bacterium]|jgi:hypothetical protein|nr:DUF3224 domain-containing protein [Thermoanaerobaculia bacterium]